jgi:hypothetical protein
MEKRLKFNVGDTVRMSIEQFLAYIMSPSASSSDRVTNLKIILGLEELQGNLIREMSPELWKIEIPVSGRQLENIVSIFGERVLKSIANNRFIFLAYTKSFLEDNTSTLKRKKYVKALYKDIVYKVEKTIICNKTYYKLFTTDTNEVVDTVFKRDRNLKLIN